MLQHHCLQCVWVGGSVSMGEREREKRGSGLGESGSVYEC